MTDNLMTVGEVAGVLHVSASTVRRLIASGQLIAARYGDGERSTLRVHSASVAQFLRDAHRRQLEWSAYRTPQP